MKLQAVPVLLPASIVTCILKSGREGGRPSPRCVHTEESVCNGPQVLSELQSYRRTGSTEDLDSPMSNPDSPGWVMNMRSQSLAALGIAPASPHTQRQLLASGKRQTPTSMLGAKRLPQHASSSRLAALAEHVSNAEMDMAQSAAEEDAQGGGSASRKGGKHTAQPPHAGRNGGKRRLSRSPIDRLAAPVGRSRLTNHDSQATGSGAHSAPDSKTSHQSASSTSAMVSSGEEGAEEGDSVLKDKMPCPIGTENPRVNLRGQSNRRRLAGTQEEWGKTANAPSNEEEWTESPVTRSSRSVKLKAGLRQSSASSNPRVVAARKAATVGSRRRSEKLSNFSGVTLKNGRCGWVTLQHVAHFTFAADQVLMSMLHGGCHTRLKCSIIDCQCCDCVCFCIVHAVNQAFAYMLTAAMSAFSGPDMPG